VVNEAEGDFSRFHISEELQSKLRGQTLYCIMLRFIAVFLGKTIPL